MIRTFIDSGVLIAAARAEHAESEPALRLLEDPGRRMLTSMFVRLEVYPKTAFHAYALQRAFLNEFFMDPSLEWASDLSGLVNLAISESERHGLAAMDALHAAAALLLGAEEFVTTEKPGKPIYRADGFHVLHISTFQST
ncbi:MAG: PIN domain-containing protein [Acidobacteria bacterium]|nr:PIN domain-containing protein [Acidobacteriota bacterium]